jgi:hypothetical protein
MPVPLTDEEARAKLFGLTVACPHNQGNPSGCQIHEVRNLSLSERLTWVKQLQRAEIDRLINSHESCLADKS